MRWPWQKRPDTFADPSRPHAFRSKSDSGIAGLSMLGGSVGLQQTNIAVAGASSRTYGCAVPGCGKPADALIHAPEE